MLFGGHHPCTKEGVERGKGERDPASPRLKEEERGGGLPFSRRSRCDGIQASKTLPALLGHVRKDGKGLFQVEVRILLPLCLFPKGGELVAAPMTHGCGSRCVRTVGWRRKKHREGKGKGVCDQGWMHITGRAVVTYEGEEEGGGGQRDLETILRRLHLGPVRIPPSPISSTGTPSPLCSLLFSSAISPFFLYPFWVLSFPIPFTPLLPFFFLPHHIAKVALPRVHGCGAAAVTFGRKLPPTGST